ncbi:ABC transporter ATP-binding protein [Elioraea tepidiphila]|uniref:ABC transporter ATP-binding protein n=1 Tax=Elioraea tepidiphila TaxID=457934 RepID=UPI00036D7204|nr:ATP-binding cassette domain-containing protein [Elioraea tepidiphila]
MLTLESISVAIAGTRVLRGVDMAIDHSGRVALVGRNGAGKTTTLRAIMGLVPLSGGRIGFEGQDLSRVPAHRRTGLAIGYAPEERRLFSSFTVEENLRLPAEVAGLSAAETRRRLDKTYAILPEIAEFKDRKAGGLSGGQGKMVALGRALMTGTKLVLLDEPFQGLAPALARRYAETLMRLREAEPELAILITESNPDLLKPMVDSAYLIERGEVRPTTL